MQVTGDNVCSLALCDINGDGENEVRLQLSYCTHCIEHLLACVCMCMHYWSNLSLHGMVYSLHLRCYAYTYLYA